VNVAILGHSQGHLWDKLRRKATYCASKRQKEKAPETPELSVFAGLCGATFDYDKTALVREKGLEKSHSAMLSGQLGTKSDKCFLLQGRGGELYQRRSHQTEHQTRRHCN
jgi:hypothetical protein